MNAASLTAAVNELIQVEDARQKLAALEAVIPVARTYPEAGLLGPLEVLNPLVRLGVEAPEKFSRVLDLIDARRASAGLLPLRTPGEKFDKRRYMSDFMARKRERERRAVDVENLMRPEKDRLIGQARLNFMREQGLRWLKERDAMLAARQESFGRKLTREERLTAIADFWEGVDAQLDELEAMAREERLKTGGRVRPNDGVTAELMEVLRDNPYKK